MNQINHTRVFSGMSELTDVRVGEYTLTEVYDELVTVMDTEHGDVAVADGVCWWPDEARQAKTILQAAEAVAAYRERKLFDWYR